MNAEHRVTVTALGQCGFLLAGGARVVTDPYLSDYVDRTFASPQTPWRRLYPAPVTLSALSPDLVLVSHAHEDHLDPDTLAPYFRDGGRATLALPAPEAYRARALLAGRVVSARAEAAFSCAGATVTPLPCAHTQLHLDDQGRFYELSYLIDFGGGNVIFFGGDMSLYDGLAARVRAAKPALLLLPANGRDESRTARGIVGNITAREAAAFAREVGAPWTPMHHDLYDVNRCAPGEPERESALAGSVMYPLAPMQSLTLQNGAVNAAE